MIGTTLAQYKIIDALGAGGMGEVWRAEDEKLGREVALKVLPEEFAQDPERMARFEREAKVLASLNHPNIAHLYGLENVTIQTAAGTAAPQGSQASPEAVVAHASRVQAADSESPSNAGAGTTTFLVMELVEGEDLSERIKRGPVPVEEATAIALQIAEALEAAHEQGIVHRDLKPANIKLRPDGTIKVLDFGLAKAWESEHTDSSLSLSPTVTNHATAAGLILGTAAYMSPEQAAGTAADRRADIWSFGVVLWEMLTGHKLFEGETVSHVLASVLKDEIDLGELPQDVPGHLRRLIGRCLRKKPKQRLQAIGDARIFLEDPMEHEEDDGSHSALVSSSSTSKAVPMLGWAVAALALCAAALMLLMQRGDDAAPVYQTTIRPPENTEFHLAAIGPGAASVSPDGTRVVYAARDGDGVARLFLRALDQPRAHVMSGTEGAQFPFWSPDSQWIAFFTQQDGTLKKVDAAGGPPITLCDAQNGKGGSWGADDTIVFAPNAGTEIFQVSASGGESHPATVVDRDRHNSHRHPRFLPDSRYFLYLARGMNSVESAVMIGSLGDGEDLELMRNTVQADYADGQFFFVRDQTLMAQPFDADSLSLVGDARPIAEKTFTIPAAAYGVYSVSPSGILTYHSGTVEAMVTPVWYDRTGRELQKLGDSAEYNTVALSADDRRAVFAVVPASSGIIDLWTYDIERDLKSRFTFEGSTDYLPLWAPDGRSIVFASDRAGTMNIFQMGLGGVDGPNLIVESERDLGPRGWSPDGRWLVYSKQEPDTDLDIWAVDMESGEERPIRAQEGLDVAGSVSPDGRWLTYYSNESGTFEVYVTPFPEAGRRWQVSTGTGVNPFWCEGNRELIYQRFDGRLMSVAIELGEDSVQFGETTDLFDISAPEALGPKFAPSADCERFLVVPGGEASASSPLHLVVGWPRLVEDR